MFHSVRKKAGNNENCQKIMKTMRLSNGQQAYPAKKAPKNERWKSQNKTEPDYIPQIKYPWVYYYIIKWLNKVNEKKKTIVYMEV